MEFLNWDESYSVSIQEFDAHHKELIDLLNDVHQKVFQCEDIEAERNLTAETLNNLLEYTISFYCGRNINEKFSYPEYEGHKKETRLLYTRDWRTFAEHKNGGVALSFSVFTILKDWIMIHILVEDKQYSEFFHKQGIE